MSHLPSCAPCRRPAAPWCHGGESANGELGKAEQGLAGQGRARQGCPAPSLPRPGAAAPRGCGNGSGSPARAGGGGSGAGGAFQPGMRLPRGRAARSRPPPAVDRAPLGASASPRRFPPRRERRRRPAWPERAVRGALLQPTARSTRGGGLRANWRGRRPQVSAASQAGSPAGG